jgi:hypothetical protein
MIDGGKCNRCGKQRVLLKSWKETVATLEGTSELSYAQYVCPDEACQKLSDKALKLIHEQHAARERANLEREQARNEMRRTKKSVTGRE